MPYSRPAHDMIMREPLRVITFVVHWICQFQPFHSKLWDIFKNQRTPESFRSHNTHRELNINTVHFLGRIYRTSERSERSHYIPKKTTSWSILQNTGDVRMRSYLNVAKIAAFASLSSSAPSNWLPQKHKHCSFTRNRHATSLRLHNTFKFTVTSAPVDHQPQSTSR